MSNPPDSTKIGSMLQRGIRAQSPRHHIPYLRGLRILGNVEYYLKHDTLEHQSWTKLFWELGDGDGDGATCRRVGS